MQLVVGRRHGDMKNGAGIFMRSLRLILHNQS
jgi:hypothetical protein